MEKKFKKGDKVRVTISKWERHFDCGNDIGALTNDDIGIVIGQSYDADFIEVSFFNGFVCLDFTEDELELIEPYDPKTAFLSELKELLEKYNAKIDVRLDYSASEIAVVMIGNEIVADGRPITADNIMDYDKE